MKVGILQSTDFNNSYYKDSIESVQSSFPFISENHDCHHMILMNGSYRKELSIDKSYTTLIDSENRYYGSSSAVNLVCNICLNLKFDAVVIVDDDMIVAENDWLSDFIVPYADNENIVMTGINALINKSDLTNQWYVDSSNKSFDYLDAPFSFLLSHWKDLGGWDEGFIGPCSNTDFCLRTWGSNRDLFKIQNRQNFLHYSHSTNENKSPQPDLINLMTSSRDGNDLFVEKHGKDWRIKYNRTHIVESGLPMYFIDSDMGEIKHRLMTYGVNAYVARREAEKICNYPISGPNNKIESVDDLNILNIFKERILHNQTGFSD